MDALTAHARFAYFSAADRLDTLVGEYTWQGPYEAVDAWPLAAAAAASLSGQLEDCETDEDLKAAVAHFLVLFDAYTFELDDWKREMARILAELIAWGERYEAEWAAPWN